MNTRGHEKWDTKKGSSHAQRDLAPGSSRTDKSPVVVTRETCRGDAKMGSSHEGIWSFVVNPSYILACINLI